MDNFYIVKMEWIKDGVIKGNVGLYILILIVLIVVEEFLKEVESVVCLSIFFEVIFKIGNWKMNKFFILLDFFYFCIMGIEVISGNLNDLINFDVFFLL